MNQQHAAGHKALHSFRFVHHHQLACNKVVNVEGVGGAGKLDACNIFFVGINGQYHFFAGGRAVARAGAQLAVGNHLLLRLVFFVQPHLCANAIAVGCQSAKPEFYGKRALCLVEKKHGVATQVIAGINIRVKVVVDIAAANACAIPFVFEAVNRGQLGKAFPLLIFEEKVAPYIRQVEVNITIQVEVFEQQSVG